MREYVKKHYVMDLVIAGITHERKAGRPLESVTLSRFNYDRLFRWLQDTGVVNDSNKFNTLSWKRVDILRSESDTSEDITFKYKLIETTGENLMNNLKMFGIENSKFIDNVSKTIKHKNGKK